MSSEFHFNTYEFNFSVGFWNLANILTTSLKNMCASLIWKQKKKKTFLLEMLKWHLYWQRAHMLVIRAHVFCSDRRVCTQTKKSSKLTTSCGARSELHSGSHQFLSSSGTLCYELSEQIGPEQEVCTGDPEPFSHHPSSHAASCSDFYWPALQRTHWHVTFRGDNCTVAGFHHSLHKTKTIECKVFFSSLSCDLSRYMDIQTVVQEFGGFVS